MHRNFEAGVVIFLIFVC